MASLSNFDYFIANFNLVATAQLLADPNYAEQSGAYAHGSGQFFSFRPGDNDFNPLLTQDAYSAPGAESPANLQSLVKESVFDRDYVPNSAQEAYAASQGFRFDSLFDTPPTDASRSYRKEWWPQSPTDEGSEAPSNDAAPPAPSYGWTEFGSFDFGPPVAAASDMPIDLLSAPEMTGSGAVEAVEAVPGPLIEGWYQADLSDPSWSISNYYDYNMTGGWF
ncbi:MAG: hypothetical protein FJX11_17220 [Alphaproteobacteria bacterium]|nr:hypothetical protein [Alphaproteobacteria bacterium]